MSFLSYSTLSLRRGLSCFALILLAGVAVAAAPSVRSNPIGFEPNRGQMNEAAAYRARGLAYSAFLTSEGPVLAFHSRSSDEAFAYRVRFAASPGSARFTGIETQPGTHYYLRPGEAGLATNVYRRVRQNGVYPGVDVVYHATGKTLEYDFTVAPGADPARIALRIEGPDAIRIDDQGRLVLDTPKGSFYQLAPVAYQQTPEGRRDVVAAYALSEDGTVTFALGEYDRRQALVIDPVLDYSTYLGAGDGDFGNAAAAADDGSVYVTGRTDSSDFPVSSGVFQNQFGGDQSDAFVTKFNADGSLAFSTFYGGEKTDFANDIALGSDGSIYIAGQTASASLPVQGYDEGFSGEIDCFVAKFSSDGKQLEYGTYLGDGDEDVCNAIAVNDAGEVYVVGYTASLDFPTTDGAVQSVNMGGRDAFVAKLSADGASLLYSSFLGGSGDDTAYDIAVGANGVHYIVGDTASSDFPIADDAQSNLNRGRDAFLAVVSADGADMMYSSYLGGSEDDFATAVAVGEDGTIAVAGETISSDFPIAGGTQGILGSAGDEDAFLALLTDMGRTTMFSTFLGGGDRDFATDVAIDSNGRIYVVGATDSDNFPVTSNALLPDARGNRDAFVAEYERSGGGILLSTYFGGEENDEASGLSVSDNGDVYVTGFTRSNNFPLQNAFQTGFNDFDIGGLEIPSEAFVMKVSALPNEAPLATVSAATFAVGPVAGGSIVSAFGRNLADSTESATSLPLPTELANVQVRVTPLSGSPSMAELFFVSPEQINFVMSAISANGAIKIEVLKSGSVVATGSVLALGTQPGIFTADFSGSGVAAAYVVQDVNGEQMRSLTYTETAPGMVEGNPIDLSAGDTVVELYATGLSGAQNVTATVAGQEVEVLFTGPNADFVGLDQMNIRIPQALAGMGEVPIVITADGKMSNTVTVTIQ